MRVEGRKVRGGEGEETNRGRRRGEEGGKEGGGGREKDRKERMREGKRRGRSHKPVWCSTSSYFLQLGPSGT